MGSQAFTTKDVDDQTDESSYTLVSGAIEPLNKNAELQSVAALSELLFTCYTRGVSDI